MKENALIENSRRYVEVTIIATFDLMEEATSCAESIKYALEILRGMGDAKVSKVEHFATDPADEPGWREQNVTSLQVYVPTELEID